MIDKLEFILALAREQHFGRAAETCGVTQPTLSAGVKQLEEQMGVLLVNRGSRFQGFTPEGERVLDWARRIVGDSRSMREEINALRHGLSGRLRIGVIPTVAPYLLPAIVGRLNALHPSLDIHVRETLTAKLIRELSEGRLDAAIVAKVEGGRKRTSSLLRWVGPSISTILSYRYPKIRAIVDGQVVSETAEYAIVGNCVMSAAVFPATPLAKTDDGLLDVCLLHELGAWKCASLALSVFSPKFIERTDVVYAQGRRVRLEPAGQEAPPLQIDGDPAGHAPADFAVEPAALRLVVP